MAYFESLTPNSCLHGDAGNCSKVQFKLTPELTPTSPSGLRFLRPLLQVCRMLNAQKVENELTPN
jgi:hypothetical protein